MSSAARNVTFRILGPIECSHDRRRLELGGPRQLTLLALLLVNANRALSSDQMIESLWGFERSDGAAKRLQVAIVRLRKALETSGTGLLGEAPLQTVGSGYRLSIAPRLLDAEVFAERVKQGRRALEGGQPARAAELFDAGLALWRGPALAEVAYEPFAQGEIRRLQELRLTALEARVDAELELGRHSALIAELESLVADHPTHERFARQLMLAFYRCGRQADALDVFQRARARLAEQLGLEPGPALRSMQAQVLAQAPALDLTPAPVRVRAPAATREAFLVLRAGHRQQRLVGLDAGRQVTLGRNPSVDVEIGWDSKVSRLHALLECVGGAWMLSDDGLSSNGTFCNHERVRGRRRLEDGDVLRLGGTMILFRDPNGKAQDRTVATGTEAGRRAREPVYAE